MTTLVQSARLRRDKEARIGYEMGGSPRMPSPMMSLCCRSSPGPMLHEHLNHVVVPHLDGTQQRVPSEDVQRVDIGAALDQQLYNRLLALLEGEGPGAGESQSRGKSPGRHLDDWG